jgi:hypothetical protein
MVSGIDEPFGQVDGVDAVFELTRSAEDAFVFAGSRVGNVEEGAEFFFDVVGVEDGVFGDALQAFASGHEDIDIGPQDDGEVAIEGSDITDGFWAVVVEGECAVFAFDDSRDGQVSDVIINDTDGA